MINDENLCIKLDLSDDCIVLFIYFVYLFYVVLFDLVNSEYVNSCFDIIVIVLLK